MSRYIDADAVIARVAGAMAYETEMETGEFIDCIEDAEELLNGIPTIDIVFCKECKYYEAKEDWCYWRDEAITADDFCSYGERAEPPIDGRELTIGNGTIPKGYGEREEEKNCPEYYDPSAWE